MSFQGVDSRSTLYVTIHPHQIVITRCRESCLGDTPIELSSQGAEHRPAQCLGIHAHLNVNQHKVKTVPPQYVGIHTRHIVITRCSFPPTISGDTPIETSTQGACRPSPRPTCWDRRHAICHHKVQRDVLRDAPRETSTRGVARRPGQHVGRHAHRTVVRRCRTLPSHNDVVGHGYTFGER